MKAEIRQVDVPIDHVVITLSVEDARIIADDILNNRYGSWTVTQLKATIAQALFDMRR